MSPYFSGFEDEAVLKSCQQMTQLISSNERRHEKRQRPRPKLVPNPKAPLRDQMHEVMRFKHHTPRTEQAFWHWIRRFILHHGKRDPRELGEAEVAEFLTHLAWLR